MLIVEYWGEKQENKQNYSNNMAFYPAFKSEYGQFHFKGGQYSFVSCLSFLRDKRW